MKVFDTLDALWQYALYCPICKDNCRTIDISIGPDNIFRLLSFEKEGNVLTLNCTYRQRKQDKFRADYTIDTITGKFSVQVSDLKDEVISEMNADTNLDELEKDRLRHKVGKSYFYFYVNADCQECKVCYASGSDIQLSHSNNNNIVYNIGIEREGMYILSTKDKYHISVLYDSNKSLINKVSIDKKTFELIDAEKTFECPVVNFDFSDFKKVINRIKTLIIFS